MWIDNEGNLFPSSEYQFVPSFGSDQNEQELMPGSQWGSNSVQLKYDPLPEGVWFTFYLDEITTKSLQTESNRHNYALRDFTFPSGTIRINFQPHSPLRFNNPMGWLFWVGLILLVIGIIIGYSTSDNWVLAIIGGVIFGIWLAITITAVFVILVVIGIIISLFISNSKVNGEPYGGSYGHYSQPSSGSQGPSQPSSGFHNPSQSSSGSHRAEMKSFPSDPGVRTYTPFRICDADRTPHVNINGRDCRITETRSDGSYKINDGGTTKIVNSDGSVRNPEWYE